jgi:hypothetical protein
MSYDKSFEFYNSTSLRMCEMPRMDILCSFLLSRISGALLQYFLDDFEITLRMAIIQVV